MSEEFDELNEERYRLTPMGVIASILYNKGVAGALELSEEIFNGLERSGKLSLESGEILNMEPAILLNGKGGRFIAVEPTE